MCLAKKSLCLHILMVSIAVAARARNRRVRFLTFNTLDDDIRVDLDFTVPFISIPIRKSVNAVIGGEGFVFPTANINMAGLALGGAMVFGSVVILPILVKAYAAHHPDLPYAKILETTRFGTDGLLNLASGVLGDGRDFHGCALKLACLTAREPNLEHSLGIFQQFSSNTLVSSMLNSTALEDAVRGGREGRDCESYYKCPIKDSYVKSLLENISRFGERK